MKRRMICLISVRRMGCVMSGNDACVMGKEMMLAVVVGWVFWHICLRL
jgi:hypothetical protein